MKLLIFSLCDNDYGHTLREAAQAALDNGAYEAFGEDVQLWKHLVILEVASSKEFARLLRYKCPQRACSASERTKKYLESRMQVYFTDTFPCWGNGSPCDHDGGSVFVDFSNPERPFVSQF